MRRGCKRTPRNADSWPVANDVNDLVQRLTRNGNVTQVILFGSGARGELTPVSDLDFCVVTTREATWELEVKRNRALRRAVPQNRAIHLWIINARNDRQFEPFSATIEREGIRLYNAGEQIPWIEARRQTVADADERRAKSASTNNVSADDEARQAANRWQDAEEESRRRLRPEARARSHHAMAVYSQEALASGLRSALRKAGVDPGDTKDLETLCKRCTAAGVGTAWKNKEIKRLNRVRRWLFEQQRGPTRKEAFAFAGTAWRVLAALNICRSDAPPQYWEPPRTRSPFASGMKAPSNGGK